MFAKNKEKKNRNERLTPLDQRYIMFPRGQSSNPEYLKGQETNYRLFVESIQRGYIESAQGQAGTFLKNNMFIGEEELAIARAAGDKCYKLIKGVQQDHIKTLTDMLHPVDIIRILLGLKKIPVQVIVDLLCNNQDFATVFNEVDSKISGNNIVHNLIADRNLTQLKACLSAIFTAQSTVYNKNGRKNSFTFNAEQKNKEHQTIWDLALETQNPELIETVLFYACPQLTPAEDAEYAHVKQRRIELIAGLQSKILSTVCASSAEEKTAHHQDVAPPPYPGR